MEQINNITEEINNNVNVIDKPKKQYKFTEKKKLAYEEMIIGMTDIIINIGKKL